MIAAQQGTPFIWRGSETARREKDIFGEIREKFVSFWNEIFAAKEEIVVDATPLNRWAVALANFFDRSGFRPRRLKTACRAVMGKEGDVQIAFKIKLSVPKIPESVCAGFINEFIAKERLEIADNVKISISCRG